MGDLYIQEKILIRVPIIRSALISGCKPVDVLDCLAEGRQVRNSSYQSLYILNYFKFQTIK